jgi:RNA polymerase sigma factor (sigma-70 family)
MRMPDSNETRAHQKIEAVWRIESTRVIAGLARIVRDIGVAEDLAHDALVAALQQWPAAGIPDNPGAWLMGTAKHRAIDYLRRGQLLERKHGELAYELGAGATSSKPGAPDLDAALDDDVGDDVLRLMFTACHPVLSQEARTALTLRLIAGLTTDEIARAYLVPEPTIAQRIVRAKKTLAAKQVPFEVPRGDDREARLASVLEVIYLIFNEGYTATAGTDWIRHGLCEEALRLARMLAELSPAEPETHGLAALLEIQASRLRARTAPDRSAVRLADQNRALWDRLLIRRGLAALERAERVSATPGPYTIQAAIAACHARALSVDQTDWARIVALYDALAAIMPSPVVTLNRAVAVGMADGPARGLDAVDRLKDSAALRNYHLLPAVRADFLSKLGRTDEAREEFERAASLTRNEAERAVLLQRAARSSRN